MGPFDVEKKGLGAYQGTDSVFGAMFGRDEPRTRATKGGRNRFIDKADEPVEYDGQLYYQIKEKDKGKVVGTGMYLPVDAVKDDGTDWNQKKMILPADFQKDAEKKKMQEEEAWRAKKKTVSQAGDRSGPLGALEYDLG